MTASGIALVIIGITFCAQLLKGDALSRLGILA